MNLKWPEIQVDRGGFMIVPRYKNHKRTWALYFHWCYVLRLKPFSVLWYQDGGWWTVRYDWLTSPQRPL